MELLSRKRSALMVSDSRKKPRTANKEPNGRKPTLVTLPCEIRLRILENLLRSRSPLGESLKIDIHPAILTPLLYTNNFMLTFLIDGYKSKMRFLKYGIYSSIGRDLQRFSSVPEILFEQVQNVLVAISIDYGVDVEPQTEEETFDHRNCVADLINPLRAFDALQKLEIHVTNSNGLAEDSPFGNDILDSLQEVRGLKSVTVCGTSPAHATKMKTIMESSETPASLQDMGNALQEYLGEDYCENEDWGEIADALGTYDVELFICTRKRIVDRTEATRAALLLQLYQYDEFDAAEIGIRAIAWCLSKGHLCERSSLVYSSCHLLQSILLFRVFFKAFP